MPLVLARSAESAQLTDPAVIEIGLINNYSDAGLASGDRQIIELLSRAADRQTVRLHFFSLPTIERGPAAITHIASRYTEFSSLRQTRLDGLIVTGCEPKMARLPEEQFWPQLVEVMDWAEHNTRSTVFSCLAAHAAVLHFDGIERRRLARKRTGLYPVRKVMAHPLLAQVGAAPRVPHSRYNDLDAAALIDAGYDILTRGPEVGVDVFIKSWRSLFVFLQGHPEYDDGALRREYKRDVLRFLDGTSDTYPDIPVGSFDKAMEERLRVFAAKARRDRDPGLITAMPEDTQAPRHAARHHEFATTLFRNWLDYLHALATNPAH